MGLWQSTNLEASDTALADLASGRVDDRLIGVLMNLSQHHRVHVTMIKTGHPMGPYSPAGRENDHFFYRAADVAAIDGTPIETDPVADGAVAVGNMLIQLHGVGRPARVMGPAAWHAALGDGDRTGFRNDDFANAIHHDHLHIGF